MKPPRLSGAGRRGLRHALGLCLLAACGSAAAQTTPPLPPLLLADGSLSGDWRYVGFPKKHADLPPTRFEAGAVDGQPGLQVLTDASYGTWVHDWRGPAPERLQWRWRLDQPLSGGKTVPDLASKAGDDAALKVCVMFEHPLDQVPFLERTVLRLARGVSGEALPAATLCYIWDSAGPAPRQGVNPYTRRVRFMVLRGKMAPLTRWVHESRDVAQDFITLFGDELPGGSSSPREAVPPVATVLIGADSDNTASSSSGWVSELRWGARSP